MTWVFCGVFLQSAQAQFDKSPWPKNQTLPSLEANDLGGNHWSSAQLRGRVVVLNFWATWCAPCLMELPTLETFYEFSDPSQIAVLTVNVRQQKSQVQQFVSSTSLSLPVVMDSSGAMAKSYGVKIYPTTLILDTKGRAIWRIQGDVDWSSREVSEWIKPLLKRSE
jgi:thiol-disulfide isomerase/thioredoxin